MRNTFMEVMIQSRWPVQETPNAKLLDTAQKIVLGIYVTIQMQRVVMMIGNYVQ